MSETVNKYGAVNAGKSSKEIRMYNLNDHKGSFVRLEIDGKWIADFNKRKDLQEYIDCQSENSALREEVERLKDTLHYLNLQPCPQCKHSEETCSNMSNEIARATSENIRLTEELKAHRCLSEKYKIDSNKSNIGREAHDAIYNDLIQTKKWILDAEWERDDLKAKLDECEDAFAECKNMRINLQAKLSRYEGGVEVEGVVKFCDVTSVTHLVNTQLPYGSFTGGQRVTVLVMPLTKR